MLTWRQLEDGACWLLGFIHVSFAIAVWAGGAERFPPPNYTTLLQATDGRVWPYALFWMAGGLFMVLGHRRLRLLGIGISLVVACVWAALFLVAALDNPTASYTPVVAYGGYGMLNGAVFGLVWLHLGRENEGE